MIWRRGWTWVSSISLQQCRQTTYPAALATAQPADKAFLSFYSASQGNFWNTKTTSEPHKQHKKYISNDKIQWRNFVLCLQKGRANCCLLCLQGGVERETFSKGAPWKDRRQESEIAVEEFPVSYKEIYFTIKVGETVECPSLVIFKACLTQVPGQSYSPWRSALVWAGIWMRRPPEVPLSLHFCGAVYSSQAAGSEIQIIHFTEHSNQAFTLVWNSSLCLPHPTTAEWKQDWYLLPYCSLQQPEVLSQPIQTNLELI